MIIKTEYANNFNEDDFVQTGDQMNELTVTITLCEYRNMVRDLIRQDMIIEQLEKEKEELKQSREIIAKMYLKNHKSEFGEIGKLAMKIMGLSEEIEENEEGEEET